MLELDNFPAGEFRTPFFPDPPAPTENADCMRRLRARLKIDTVPDVPARPVNESRQGSNPAAKNTRAFQPALPAHRAVRTAESNGHRRREEKHSHVRAEGSASTFATSPHIPRSTLPGCTREPQAADKAPPASDHSPLGPDVQRRRYRDTARYSIPMLSGSDDT